MVGGIATTLLVATLSFGGAIEGYLQELAREAKERDPNFTGFSKERGERIFTSLQRGKRGKKMACTSCHTRDLTQWGEQIFTGKKIAPLAPRANGERLQDIKKVKKWLRRNFKDTYGREGTPQEKGDVLLYILNF
ncbi:MAG: DUF1924 domain-containing protein [Epsilonproteobacteria bacterium]|nr:hypothetical protein [Campylobacterota bacterium]NPA56855.1 DUF1924 domain-containing protein [Campylobacterota bacterium]